MKELKVDKLTSILFIALCFNSVLYYNISNSVNDDFNPFNPGTEIMDGSPPDDYDDYEGYDPFSNRIKTEVFEGDFKTFAYFSGGNTESGLDLIDDPEYPDDPENNDTSRYPNVVEWVTYNDIESGAHIPKIIYWRALQSEPPTWPSTANVWHHLKERDWPYEPSKMFSPVFTEDYEIKGKVFYLAYLETNDEWGMPFSEYIDIDMRFCLYLFNPADNNKTLISYVQPPTFTVNITHIQRTFVSEINDTYTIPAGYRLLFDIEYKFSTIPAYGSLLYRTGVTGAPITWTINDGVYSNDYTFSNYEKMGGLQLYMRSKEFPDITFYNAVNDTVYHTAQQMNIDVTPGSISSYRWDYGSWVSFSDSTTTNLPAIHAWHYLEIRASDPIYNNTRYEYYQFIYDASETNFELHAPHTNGSIIIGGILLNFTAYYVDTVTYEWDKNGTQFPLTDPYDIITPDFELDHNITIRISDFYMTETLRYFFTFNSNLPSVTLDNVINGGTYAPLKTIDVVIFDAAGIKDVQYHWDSDENLTWTPTTGNIYRTNLPLTDGIHVLHIYALDNYDQAIYESFNFITDSNVFLVELQNLTNNSYYVGGETVKVTVQKINGTVYFIWDSGAVKEGTVISQTLTLAGANSMPDVDGVHNLTIITYDLSEVEHIFYFRFTVDKAAPIVTPTQVYNNTRTTTEGQFWFMVTDNYIASENLYVSFSMDGNVNKTIAYFGSDQYYIGLNFLADGDHNIYFYFIDFAGNYEVLYFEFEIDDTPPEIEYTISDLVSSQGVNYIPGNTEVTVTVEDVYSDVTTTYTWDGQQYSFTDSFILPNENNPSTLYITAFDGLHYTQVLIDLTIDISSPTVNLFGGRVNDTSEVNFETVLEFVTSDNSGDNRITMVRYSWNILPGAWYTSPDHDFNVSVIPFYEHEDIVTFYVYVEDIVGNNHIEWFQFIIDSEPPVIDLEVYDSEWVNITSSNFAQGNHPIRYNSEANEEGEVISFNYYWGEVTDDNKKSLDVSKEYPTIDTPPIDGEYNLTVILVDNVYNEINQTFLFYIDNIRLTFNITDGFELNLTTNVYEKNTSLIYGENVSYLVEVTDNINFTEIIGLQTAIVKENPTLNISVEVFKLADNITYEIIITANDVTDDIFTKIEIQFFKLEQSKQLVQIYLKVDKKEGVLLVHQLSVDEVIYGENITIIIYLINDFSINETILSIIVNGDLITDFIYFGEGLFQFNYSSIKLERKGSHILNIQAQSEFFYGTSNVFSVEILPLQSQISVEVTNYEVIEESQLIIRGVLTSSDGSPLSNQPVQVIIYVIEESNGHLVYALNAEDYDYNITLTVYTDVGGYFTASFQMTAGIEYVDIEVFYVGNDIYDVSSSVLDASVYSMKPPGLPSWLLYTIIGGSVLLGLIVSLIIYKIVKPKPFEALMEKITDEQIALNYSIMSPGVVLSIFDQRKGPVPLVMDHSLELGRYAGRLRMGTENFILKISDQAYSSLGFEEHDTGRRVGSIVLPGEKMVGWVHGIQLPNETARGGFENLSLIVLADSEYSNLLLNYQDYLFNEADKLVVALKAKDQLDNVKTILEEIRKKAVIIMLAAQGIEEK